MKKVLFFAVLLAAIAALIGYASVQAGCTASPADCPHTGPSEADKDARASERHREQAEMYKDRPGEVEPWIRFEILPYLEETPAPCDPLTDPNQCATPEPTSPPPPETATPDPMDLFGSVPR